MITAFKHTRMCLCMCVSMNVHICASIRVCMCALYVLAGSVFCKPIAIYPSIGTSKATKSNPCLT